MQTGFNCSNRKNPSKGQIIRFSSKSTACCVMLMSSPLIKAPQNAFLLCANNQRLMLALPPECVQAELGSAPLVFRRGRAGVKRKPIISSSKSVNHGSMTRPDSWLSRKPFLHLFFFLAIGFTPFSSAPEKALHPGILFTTRAGWS